MNLRRKEHDLTVKPVKKKQDIINDYLTLDIKRTEKHIKRQQRARNPYDTNNHVKRP